MLGHDRMLTLINQFTMVAAAFQQCTAVDSRLLCRARVLVLVITYDPSSSATPSTPSLSHSLPVSLRHWEWRRERQGGRVPASFRLVSGLCVALPTNSLYVPVVLPFVTVVCHLVTNANVGSVACACLPVCLSACLSVCLSACLSVGGSVFAHLE